MENKVGYLSNDYGLSISKRMTPVAVSGESAETGWARMFDISADPFGISEGYSALILAEWDEEGLGTVTEAYTHWGFAALRWLQWQEAFSTYEEPSPKDIVIYYDDEEEFWSIAGAKVRVKEWTALNDFIENTVKKTRKYKDSSVWFFDKTMGNYYRW
jgi:hypothetical protein